MASISKHGAERLRLDSGWVDVDEEDVTQRRTVTAYCVKPYADGETVKLTVLQKRYVRWSEASGMIREWSGGDWHTWGWKIRKQYRCSPYKATEVVAKQRERFAELVKKG